MIPRLDPGAPSFGLLDLVLFVLLFLMAAAMPTPDRDQPESVAPARSEWGPEFTAD